MHFLPFKRKLLRTSNCISSLQSFVCTGATKQMVYSGNGFQLNETRGISLILRKLFQRRLSDAYSNIFFFAKESTLNKSSFLGRNHATDRVNFNKLNELSMPSDTRRHYNNTFYERIENEMKRPIVKELLLLSYRWLVFSVCSQFTVQRVVEQIS